MAAMVLSSLACSAEEVLSSAVCVATRAVSKREEEEMLSSGATTGTSTQPVSKPRLLVPEEKVSLEFGDQLDNAPLLKSIVQAQAQWLPEDKVGLTRHEYKFGESGGAEVYKYHGKVVVPKHATQSTSDLITLANEVSKHGGCGVTVELIQGANITWRGIDADVRNIRWYLSEVSDVEDPT